MSKPITNNTNILSETFGGSIINMGITLSKVEDK
jgi:hypothetical protein